MKVRVGVDASIDNVFLEDFTKEVQLVRIPEEPDREIEIDFWVAAMPPRILRRQWTHLKGVQVVQAPWAGVDTLLNIFPPEVTLCDAVLHRHAAPGQMGHRTTGAPDRRSSDGVCESATARDQKPSRANP